MEAFHEVVKKLMGLSEEDRKEILAFIGELERRKPQPPPVPRRSPCGILKGILPDFSLEEIKQYEREHHEACLRQLEAEGY